MYIFLSMSEVLVILAIGITAGIGTYIGVIRITMKKYSCKFKYLSGYVFAMAAALALIIEVNVLTGIMWYMYS